MNRNRFVMPCNEPPLRLRRAKIIDFFLSIFAQRQQANDSCHGQNNDQFFLVWFFIDRRAVDCFARDV